jgi:hypothetical protein
MALGRRGTIEAMDSFDDVSVLTSVDESPPPPRVSRGVRRAFKGVVASVVVVGALAGASVGLGDEKSEPSKSATAPSDASPVSKRGGHECHRGMHRQESTDSSAMRY